MKVIKINSSTNKLLNRVKQIQSVETTFGPLQLIDFNKRQLLEL